MRVCSLGATRLPPGLPGLPLLLGTRGWGLPPRTGLSTAQARRGEAERLRKCLRAASGGEARVGRWGHTWKMAEPAAHRWGSCPAGGTGRSAGSSSNGHSPRCDRSTALLGAHPREGRSGVPETCPWPLMAGLSEGAVISHGVPGNTGSLVPAGPRRGGTAGLTPSTRPGVPWTPGVGGSSLPRNEADRATHPDSTATAVGPPG